MGAAHLPILFSGERLLIKQIDHEHYKYIILSSNTNNINICERNQKKRRNEITEATLPSNLVVLGDQLALVDQWDQLGPVTKEVKKRMRKKSLTVLYKELNG